MCVALFLFSTLSCRVDTLHISIVTIITLTVDFHDYYCINSWKDLILKHGNNLWNIALLIETYFSVGAVCKKAEFNGIGGMDIMTDSTWALKSGALTYPNLHTYVQVRHQHVARQSQAEGDPGRLLQEESPDWPHVLWQQQRQGRPESLRSLRVWWVLSSVQFSSRWYLCRISEEPICTPPCLSEVPPTSPSKHLHELRAQV